MTFVGITDIYEETSKFDRFKRNEEQRGDDGGYSDKC